MKIAVLLTSFNRKEKTLHCLRQLAQQQLPAGIELETFLTDDNSSDGTAAAVQISFPAVHVLKGNGHLFWAGGMRHTWSNARHGSPDYYLLLNDDTSLNTNAVAALLSAHAEDQPGIIIGSTCDDHSGRLSYGGWKLTSTWRWKSKPVFSSTEITDCDFANANIMLVPAAVVEKAGILSSVFTHGLADYDYCLRAKELGFPIRLAPGFLGTCIDDHGRNWKSYNSTLKERIQYLKSPKGLAYKEYLFFIRQHFPFSLPASFLKLWMKTFFPFVWDRLKN